MNTDRVAGNWTQIKGKVKAMWGEFTGNQMVAGEGKRDEIAGKLRESYGITMEHAHRQVNYWQAKAQVAIDSGRQRR